MRPRICANYSDECPIHAKGAHLSFGLKELADHFDAGARIRGDIRANRYGVADLAGANALYAKVVDEILDILNLEPGKRVLDVGCGTGDILSRLQAKGADATGLDLSPLMVQIARERGCQAELYGGGKFPLPDESFDIALIYQVIINLPELHIAENLLSEAARVIRPGGMILVGAVPHPVRSRFPTHRSRWWVDTKIRLRKMLLGRGTIPYYSYPYSFFEKQLDGNRFRSLTFVPCRVTHPGWDTKYHAIFVT